MLLRMVPSEMARPLSGWCHHCWHSQHHCDVNYCLFGLSLSIPLETSQATPQFMVVTVHYLSTWTHHPLTPSLASAECRRPQRRPPPRWGYMSPSTCPPLSPSTSRPRRLLPHLLCHRNAEPCLLPITSPVLTLPTTPPPPLSINGIFNISYLGSFFNTSYLLCWSCILLQAI